MAVPEAKHVTDHRHDGERAREVGSALEPRLRRRRLHPQRVVEVMEGRGRAWKGVEGCGRAWKGVEGRGRAWKGVEGWWKKAEMTHLHPEHAIEVHPRSMREGVLEDLHLLEEAQRVELRGKRGAQARGAMRASVC